MITKFKIYESTIGPPAGLISARDRKLNSATLYLEEIQPVSWEEGFIECYWEDDPVIITFCFNLNTTEESYEKFDNFLKDNRLEIYKDSCHPYLYTVEVKLSEYKVKKFADLYDNMKKYNL